jgi:hypothetical protein
MIINAITFVLLEFVFALHTDGVFCGKISTSPPRDSDN